MKIRRQREFWCGVLFVAVGLAFAWAAGTWPLGHWASPGPGFLGLCLALALTMLGGLVLFMATTIESPGGDPFVPLPARPTLLILAALLVCGLLLPRAGLLLTVSAATLLARLSWPLNEPRAGEARAAAGPMRARVMLSVAVALIAQAAAVAFAVWLVCHVVLKLHLPLWPLPPAAWTAA